MTEILEYDIYQKGEDVIAGTYKNAEEAIKEIMKTLHE